MDPMKIYFDGLSYLEPWRINRSKDKITRDGQYWCWCPNRNIDGKFNGMYMNHTSNKHNKLSEEIHINI